MIFDETGYGKHRAVRPVVLVFDDSKTTCQY